MKRREETPLRKVSLFLYEGDFERLRELRPRLGSSKVIRTLIRNFINRVEAEAEARRTTE